MSTYFHGSSEIQAGGGDGLQTLILMNPTTGYVGFSERQQPPPPPQQQQQQPPTGSNFVFFNSSNTPGGNSLNFIHAPPSHTLHHHQQQQQQLVGIPLTSPTNQSAISPQDHQVQYNPYSQNFDHGVAREIPRSQQGLSLRLSSQQPAYGSFRPDHEVPSQPLVTTISAASGCDAAVGVSSSVSGISNNVNGMQGVSLLNSKYLKAAQELLDEVVNVNKGLKSNTSSDSGKGVFGLAKNIQESSSEIPAAGEVQSNSGKLDSELTTTERQEIQMKKAKLVNMVDEVEQRYRQYHHQMQIVISWFEQAAGIGSAKTYTALALQTISKQFRCLKDAILGQIRAASKRLGEEDSIGGKTEGSRLKFIDNQLRQQRALQQLGMVQHNVWRPQRGLPERSVSVLRAWLFEHFLHPYPKESDKFMLAKQTGLTRSQVSNWFINARVRLWKPMVEEMYTEEMKEQEKKGKVEKSGDQSENNQDSVFKTATASPEKTSSFENQNKAYISNQELAFNQNVASPNSVSPANSPTGINIQNHSGFNLIGSPEMESMTQGSPKKPRATVLLHPTTNVPSISMDENHADLNNDHLSMNFGIERQSREGFTLLGGSTNFIEGFGSYPIAELGGRFSAEQFQAPYSGNGFSLTLGLPQWENLTMPGSHQPFLQSQNIQMSRGVEIGDTSEYGNKNTPTSNDSINVYDHINIQDRKRLAGQMLQDFVA